MSTLLDASLVADTLTSLPGWQGDTAQLFRDVHLSPELDVELRRQVAVDAAAMGHAATVATIEGGSRYTLRSEEAGGVTELDVALASHISDLVHRLSPAEPGIDAVRDDDPVVIFRPGEGAGGDDVEPADDGTFTHAQAASGGSTPTFLPGTSFEGQDERGL